MTAVTEAEWEIMRVLWARHQSTSHELIDILGEAMNWKAATIKTLLGRLKAKGIVTSRRDGRQFIYRPAVSEKEVVKKQMLNIFERICQRDAGKTVSAVLPDIPLSQSDIDQLIQELTDLKEKAPATIQCQCLPGQCECRVD